MGWCQDIYVSVTAQVTVTAHGGVTGISLNSDVAANGLFIFMFERWELVREKDVAIATQLSDVTNNAMFALETDLTSMKLSTLNAQNGKPHSQGRQSQVSCIHDIMYFHDFIDKTLMHTAQVVLYS